MVKLTGGVPEFIGWLMPESQPRRNLESGVFENTRNLN